VVEDELAELRKRIEALEARTEIEAQRINIVEPDGRVRLVISGAARAPDPVCDGQTFEREGGNPAGIIFYNDEGDECGGLVFGGGRANGGYSAGGVLLFDQFKQDQVIGLSHDDRDGRRRAGLTVWDRPEEPFPEVGGARRIFVGKTQDRAAIVELLDTAGTVRLRLAVGPANQARIEFFDEAGELVARLPDNATG
jgi:hypothetical protein